MTAAHTPGPWEAVDSLTVRGPFAFGDPEKCGLLLASLPHYLGAEERLANARLIAAAPDLLVACRMAIVALKGREHDGFLRDAIAKATGSAA